VLKVEQGINYSIMKISLYFQRSSVLVLLLCYFINTSGQTVIFSEDFSGFINGTHASPSTSDASGSLDTKTQIPGWSGYKIYSAAGEIKIGIEDVTGWIETPLITFSGGEGNLILKFDICRWTGDATIVRVLLDGTQIGSTLTPGDAFQNVEIPITPGISSGKIRFEGVAKRFFLDNVQIVRHYLTSAGIFLKEREEIEIFPNPAADIVTIKNCGGFEILEVLNSSGKICLTKNTGHNDRIELHLNGLDPGIYFIRLSSPERLSVNRIIISH